MARATLTIDLGAVVANWRALDALSGPAVETAAVIKADAYGLGADRVGPALARAGAKSFFVALTAEGAALRAAVGPVPQIYILSGLMPGDGDEFRHHDLIPVLNSARQIAEFTSKMSGRPCALQLDTGMHRLGMGRAELASVIDTVRRLRPQLCISHLACADTPEHPLNAAQRAKFAALTAGLPAMRLSLAATGGVLLGPDFHYDCTRPGIGLYGGLPFAAARPVVTLALPVVQVRDVAPGGAVGYGATWVADTPARIATIAAGYADGLHRALGRGAVQLYAGGRPCPLVGRVSMDLITVDVTGLSEVPDRLEILNAQQTVDDLAGAAGTIGYEILTSLGDRYDRVYNEPA